MSDEVEIQIVDGDEDDPFTQQTDPLASASASEGEDEEDGQGAEDDDQEDATGAEDDNEDATAYTPAQQAALAELAEWQAEQARAAAAAATSQLQSKYDRQLAAQGRTLKALQEQAAAERQELQAAVREAKLNGLTDVEKAQLQEQWNKADTLAELDAYRDQLSDMHVELLRTAYVTEYAQFGLEEGDLDTFNSPEEMEAFVKDVQIEYYRLMSDPAVQAALAEDGAPAAAVATGKPAPAPAARKSPAGANAPTDAGGGGAPPPATKFNSERGVSAMAENIRSGWESPRAR